MASQSSTAAAALANDLRAVFTAELQEQLGVAAALLPELSPARPEQRQTLRRIFHTIKGGAGLAGRSDLAAAAESLERFFSDPKPAPPPTALKALFEAAELPLPALAPAIAAPVANAVRVLPLLVGGRRFALPLASVEGAAAVIAADAERAIVLGGDSHPVVPLHALLGAVVPRRTVALLVGGAGRRAALLIERVGAPADLRVWPLAGPLAVDPLVAGAAVGADGVICCVLDPDRLVALADPPQPAAAVEAAVDVLVVDDSQLVRSAIAGTLAAAQVHFDLAADGRAALARLTRRRYAVVLTDLEMPELDGYGLIAAIRADVRWASQPVIVCSSRSADERLAGLDVAGYLAKPFSASALLAVLSPFVQLGANGNGL